MQELQPCNTCRHLVKDTSMDMAGICPSVIMTASRWLLSTTSSVSGMCMALRKATTNSAPSSGELALFMPVLAASRQITHLREQKEMLLRKGWGTGPVVSAGMAREMRDSFVVDDVPERMDGQHLNRHPQPKLDRLHSCSRRTRETVPLAQSHRRHFLFSEGSVGQSSSRCHAPWPFRTSGLSCRSRQLRGRWH